MNGKIRCFRYLFCACAAAIVAQALSLFASAGKDPTISNWLIGFMGVLMTAACVCAFRRSKDAGKLWLLLGVGFLLTTAGQLSSTYYEIVTNTHVQNFALNSDFLYFAYGIPILLAVCSGSNEEGLRSLLWLDVAQATVALTLTYVQIFSALPAFGGQIPISAVQLMYLYNFENWILAGTVALRLISNPPPIKKRFYENLAIYLWIYAVVALADGYLELALKLPDGLQDILWGVPYLVFLATLAFRREVDQKVDRLGKRRQMLSLLIDNLSPILFTVAIVLMGVTVATTHKTLAFLCITTAVLLYGMRAALLHGKYARAQEELTKAAAALMDANDKLLTLAIRDSLTGIYNRRHFDEALMQEWTRSRRSGKALSLLMIDVDCFKALNDRYGHQVGDECLRRIAVEIASRLRRHDDLVARYGGEEFVVVLPDADTNGAFVIAEAIRMAIEGIGLPNQDSIVHNVVTVSIGVSTDLVFLENGPSGLLKRADSALYMAKTLGRNQCHAQDETISDRQAPVTRSDGDYPLESSHLPA